MNMSAFGPSLLMVQRRSGRAYVPAGGEASGGSDGCEERSPSRHTAYLVPATALLMSCCLSSTEETFGEVLLLRCQCVWPWTLTVRVESRSLCFCARDWVFWIMIKELPCCVSWTYKIAWQHYNPRLLSLFLFFKYTRLSKENPHAKMTWKEETLVYNLLPEKGVWRLLIYLSTRF